MLNLIVSSLAVALAAAPVPVVAAGDDPAIEVWMSGDRRFRQGERARIQIDTRVDGYLLVLHYDTDGRVNVLFPIAPGDDAFIRSGRRYEIRDERDSRHAFQAGYPGTGLVWAAVSADPWRFPEFSSGDAWDYGLIAIDRDSEDAERDLTDLAQRMSGPGGFDYDVTEYRVYGDRPYAESYPARTVYVYDDYYSCSPWAWSFRSCYTPRYSWSIGIAFGSFYHDPWYYDPWYYDPWYYRSYWPYRYGYYPYGYSPYRYGYGYPYYDPFYFPRTPIYVTGNRPVIVGRPRGYTIERRPFGTRTTLAGTGTRPGTAINWRARETRRFDAGRDAGRDVTIRNRPDGSGGGGTARPSTGGGDSRPRARPARPRGGDRDARPATGGGSGRPEARGNGGSTPKPNVERGRGNGGSDKARPSTERARSGDRGRRGGDADASSAASRGPARGEEFNLARRARPSTGSNPPGGRDVRGAGGNGPRVEAVPGPRRVEIPSARGRPESGRSAPEPRASSPAARSRPQEYREPPARSRAPEYRQPPARSTAPEYREPPARSRGPEPRAQAPARREPPQRVQAPARREPLPRAQAPSRQQAPARAQAPSRRDAPAPRAQSGGRSGGERSAPSRGRGRGGRDN